ncbi:MULTISPECIES: hypothetical protein [Actinomycetes]|uniref:hypothetical protein n=1 Tax=Actinomycetes TaxID=1760 RepID=UPI0004C15813|nr:MULTISPECIES: hypothetical protein [Actinomycetes]
MSFFDDAIGGHEQGMTANADYERKRLAAAEQLAPRVRELLCDLASTLTRRGVRTRTVQLTEKRGLLRPARHSPPGFILNRAVTPVRDSSGHNLVDLIDSKGNLWCWRAGEFEGFVTITPEWLVNPSPKNALFGPRVDHDASRLIVRMSNSDNHSDELLEHKLQTVAKSLYARREQ